MWPLVLQVADRQEEDHGEKIGMIGELSWLSTAEYYKRINEITQSVAGGVSSARIVLDLLP